MVDYKTNNPKMMIDWWQSPLGQHVLMQEKALLKSLVSHFYGYYQLQIGIDKRMLPEVSIPSQQKIMAKSADVEGNSEALPFKCHSIDTLLLSHELEFSADPHQVLREVERVLVADGTLILCCFNPWSLWGLRRLFSWQSNPPWHGHFFSQSRIKDWLALLNFEVITIERFLFCPPVRSEKWLGCFAFMERVGMRIWPAFSGARIMVAKKRTIPLTPVTMNWRTGQLFPTGRLVNKPVTREKING